MIRIINTDVIAGLKSLPEKSVHCVVTSPPYWGLRDYGVEGQIGLEKTPEEYVSKMVQVFREVRRVLRDDGTIWLNLGDCYATETDFSRANGPFHANKTKRGQVRSLKQKDMVGIPWRVAFALQADGWYLRSDIIWSKPNPMPESVTDRPTKSHEYVFLLTKKARYFYDADAVRERYNENSLSRYNYEFGHGDAAKIAKSPAVGNGEGHSAQPNPAGRNRRDVWTITTQPNSDCSQTVLLNRVHNLDEVSYDTMHIVSPNCPYHADLLDLVAKDFCDGHEVDWKNHISHIGSDLSLKQDYDSSSIPQNHKEDYILYTLDFDSPDNSEIANGHNKQSRKKDRVLLTNSPYMPFVQKISRIPDRQALFLFFVQQMNSSGNNILPDEMDAHLLAQIPHRIAGKFSSKLPNNCMCSFYKKIIQETSHFATFPEALVEPCIKAGTSERGCCSVCGAPWVRVVEKGEALEEWKKMSGADSNGEYHGKAQKDYLSAKAQVAADVKRRILEGMRERISDWQPSCTCNAETVPCTVLDPFGGSGTVAKVARDLNRDAILIEINPAYVEIARRKLRADEQLFENVKVITA